MSRIYEICKYLDAKFIANGKIQGDIKELFIYRASAPPKFFKKLFAFVAHPSIKFRILYQLSVRQI